MFGDVDCTGDRGAHAVIRDFLLVYGMLEEIDDQLDRFEKS